MKTFLPVSLSFALMSVLPSFAADDSGDEEFLGKETPLVLPVPQDSGNTLASVLSMPSDRVEEEKPVILTSQSEPSAPLGGFLPLWPVGEPPPVRLLEPWLTDQTPPVRLLEPWIIRGEAVAVNIEPQVEPE